jgi:hypothetical protein
MPKLKPTTVPKVLKPQSANDTKTDYSFWFSSDPLDWYGGANNRKWRKKHNDKRKQA